MDIKSGIVYIYCTASHDLVISYIILMRNSWVTMIIKSLFESMVLDSLLSIENVKILKKYLFWSLIKSKKFLNLINIFVNRQMKSKLLNCKFTVLRVKSFVRDPSKKINKNGLESHYDFYRSIFISQCFQLPAMFVKVQKSWLLWYEMLLRVRKTIFTLIWL